MTRFFHFMGVFVILTFGLSLAANPGSATAAGDAEIDNEVSIAMKDLYGANPVAKRLGKTAKAVLIFPKIIKGGFMVGGQYGEGALLKGHGTVAYYNTISASYGWQLGLQRYGYALFFMKDAALSYLDRSDGWEVGVGPSIVIVDDGMAKSMTTTTTQADVYAFFFDQRGLMAGMGLQGTKITRMEK